ncbi:uncharacterized protein F4822DRAFT_239681 [Hypoxylon trugodes]|uniref:uncharacterized protein n=1 Tax=Hypoxylon trugodes TaxID=326681 RepID=UPI0021A08E03|nr:uncharacterized protein F4822DRAFT_239681 [Hypoxylon trugodes]KAI1388243.1 hypothetical protein F4822DRAFT_239681 [Hypoxylon trugodes]
MNKLQSMLLTALEDFWRVADILVQHEPVLDTKSFYCLIFAQSFQLHHQILEVTQSEAILDFLENRLIKLESFIVSENLQTCHIQEDPAVPYPNLVALHHQLVQIKDNNHPDSIRCLRKCIDFGTKENQTELVDWMRESNDFFKVQALKSAIPQEVDLAIPLKVRQRPPDGIWPAASSLFNVLDSRRRCACNPAHTYAVQLCLETHRTKLMGCDFDLYLSLGQLWQEARVQTAAPLPSSLPSQHPKITINDNGRKAVNTGTHCRERMRMVEELYRDIIKITKTSPDYRLRFRLEKDSL